MLIRLVDILHLIKLFMEDKMMKIRPIICILLTVSMICGLLGCATVSLNMPDENKNETAAENASAEEAKETSNIYSTDMFEITLPDDLKDIADVEVSSDRIDVFHRESKDAGFGGLEFSIWAVEVPKEYAGGPYKKIGEINSENGRTFDVVKGEATEIQWDYNLEEMSADFEKICDSTDGIISTITGINGYTYLAGAGMKGEDLYGDVLEKYVQAVNEEWDANKLEEEDMSPEFFYMGSHTEGGLDNIGFAYRDINVDGIDELLVGDMADTDGKSVIYDVYTMVDRKPVHVVTGTARDRYYDFDNVFLCNEWSGGAGLSGYDLYALMNNSTELVYQYGYKYDSYENEEKPWFVAYDKDKYESVSEEEFNENLSQNESRYVKLDYTPLSKFDGSSSGDDGDPVGTALPAYDYPGPELFYSVLYSYMTDELSKGYPDCQVSIPCPVIIAEEETDKSDIRVYGNFWIFNYDLNGETLECASGGSYPGCIHIEDTDEGYKVTSMDVVEDGSGFTESAKKIFGKYYDSFMKDGEDEKLREETRAQIIANYVAANNLNITAYKDYGWDPVKLPEENIDSFYSKLD